MRLRTPVRAVLALSAVVLLAGCGSSVASPSGAASAAAASATAAATTSPASTPAAATVPPSVSPSPAATPTATPPPSATEFWSVVRRGLAASGHLVVTATGGSPVVVRYLPASSAAVVANDVVSICTGGASYQGGAGTFALVAGTWRCGADALVAGFRATGAPIDAWNPDFPPGGTIDEKVAITTDGRWRWTFVGRGSVEGDVSASLLLDPRTRRLVAGSRIGQLGKTSFAFDYGTVIAPIVKP